jgi:MFS family permease
VQEKEGEGERRVFWSPVLHRARIWTILGRKGALMAQKWSSAIRGFNRDTRVLIAAFAALGFSYWGLFSVVANLFLLRLGYAIETIGVLTAVGFIVATVSSIPAGILGARLGNRNILALSLGACAAGMMLHPLALFLGEPLRFTLIVAARIILLAGGTCFLVNWGPAVAAATDVDNRTHAFSLNGAGNSIGTMLGSVAGGFLPGAVSRIGGAPLDRPHAFGWSIAAGAVPYAVCLALVLARVGAARGEGGRAGERSGASPLGLIAFMTLTYLLTGAGYGIAANFLSVFLDTVLRMEPSKIGLLMSLSPIAAIAAAGFVPRLSSRVGKRLSIIAGLLGMGIGVSLLAARFDPGTAAAGWVVFSCSNVVATTVLGVHIMEIVSERWRSIMAGATMMANALGMGISAFAGGFLISVAGYRIYFLLGTGVLAVAALLFSGYTLSRRSQAPRKDAARG